VPTVITLTNNGTAALYISFVTLSGAVQGNFSQTNNCAALAANNTCSISVTFAPTSAGTQAASVQIVSNAPTSPDTISLSGTAD